MTDDTSLNPAPHRPHPQRRRQEPGSPGRIRQQDSTRRQDWGRQTPQEIVARFRAGKAPPLRVLEVMLSLFKALHTSIAKTVCHKTRQERAQFLRRFFRDLHQRPGSSRCLTT